MSRQRLLLTLIVVAMTVHSSLAQQVKVIGQNVQNFFYSVDRGRTQGSGSISMSYYSTEAGRDTKLDAIVGTLSQYEADVYAFNEVECCAEVLQLLAQRMTEYTQKTYLPVADGLTYDKSTEPDGAIKSGFIYNATTVEPVGDNVTTAVGYKNVYPATMRMQAFKAKSTDEVFYISMNHFKASTSADPLYDTNQRESNSISLLKGLDQAVLDPDILVMGDLNSEMGEQCLNNLVDAGYTEQILEHEGSEAASHWYISDGSLIDHVFANSTMAAQITDARMLYVANPHSTGSYSTAYSDHDPYMVTLNLQAQPEVKYCYKKVNNVTPGRSYIMVFNDEMVANAVDITKTYEYLTISAVSPDGDVITLPSNKNSYKLEEVGDGTYFIKDHYGRYLYQYHNGTSYNSSTSAGTLKDAHAHNVTLQSNGTFHVHNILSNGNILYEKKYNTCSWRDWTSLNTGNYWPTLWEYDPDVTPSAITDVTVCRQPATTIKVVEQGRIIIKTPRGNYNVNGTY